MDLIPTDLPQLLAVFRDGMVIGGGCIAVSYIFGIVISLAVKIMTH